MQYFSVCTIVIQPICLYFPVINSISVKFYNVQAINVTQQLLLQYYFSTYIIHYYLPVRAIIELHCHTTFTTSLNCAIPVCSKVGELVFSPSVRTVSNKQKNESTTSAKNASICADIVLVDFRLPFGHGRICPECVRSLIVSLRMLREEACISLLAGSVFFLFSQTPFYFDAGTAQCFDSNSVFFFPSRRIRARRSR